MFTVCERIPNLSAEQSDGITVFRISPMQVTDAPPVSHRYHQLAELDVIVVHRSGEIRNTLCMSDHSTSGLSANDDSGYNCSANDRFLWPSKVNVDMCSSEKNQYFRVCAHLTTYGTLLQIRYNKINNIKLEIWSSIKSRMKLAYNADEPREFNLPTSPQRRITYMQEKLPSKYGVHSEEYLPIRTLLEDILFIDSNFKIVSKSIILLESPKLQLSEALNIVDKVSQTVIQNNNSLISEKLKSEKIQSLHSSIWIQYCDCIMYLYYTMSGGELTRGRKKYENEGRTRKISLKTEIYKSKKSDVSRNVKSQNVQLARKIEPECLTMEADPEKQAAYIASESKIWAERKKQGKIKRVSTMTNRELRERRKNEENG
ncbi:hypothetical protein ANN_26080 [Periplaneta americana]|uniref:Uncharacterized protein n=1 Tax=Periplaneta americana TaxID=6978 RepID=A0ABQ8S5C9_PERAM|nr:hypothetical protein ANN_26080 [Periplaneta americana]